MDGILGTPLLHVAAGAFGVLTLQTLGRCGMATAKHERIVHRSSRG